MTPPAPSPFAWPILLGASSLAFPALAALYARRSLLREPGGQVAGALLLVLVINLLGLAQVLGLVPRGVPVSSLVFAVHPLLTVVPLLSWIGGSAPRRRPLVQGAAAAALGAGLLLLGPGREFHLVVKPAAGVLMTSLCALALAQSVRAGVESRADGRTIVLGGLLTYFVITIVASPLIETLVGADPRALIDAHMGLQLVYAGCMTAIAWGVARRVPAATPAPRRGPEPTRAPVVDTAPPVVAPPDAYPEPKRPAARQAV